MIFIMKKCLLAVLLCCSIQILKAQTAEEIYDEYTDYNKALFERQTDKAFTLGQKLLPNIEKLPAKTRTNFLYIFGKQYEDRKEFDKALPLYEKVAAAEPDYYVVHLALGHIYLRKAKELQTRDKAAYTAMINKIIPHFEKVQACDPYDENLALIKQLYHSINNDAGFAGLNDRLKPMKTKCLDILQDH